MFRHVCDGGNQPVLPFHQLYPLELHMGCATKYFPPLAASSSWTSLCLMVCQDGSRLVLVPWPLSVFQPDFRQLFADDS